MQIIIIKISLCVGGDSKLVWLNLKRELTVLTLCQDTANFHKNHRTFTEISGNYRLFSRF